MRISDWSSDVCSSDLPARPAAGAAAGDQHRQYPEDRGRLLRVADQGFAVQAPDPFAGPPPPGGDGPCEGADRTQPARDRRRLRVARPPHGAARMPPDPRLAPHSWPAARGPGHAAPPAQRMTANTATNDRRRRGEDVYSPWTTRGLFRGPKIAQK